MGRKLIALSALLSMALAVPAGAGSHELAIEVVGEIAGTAEIATFDNGRLFVTSGDGVDVYAVGTDGSLTLDGRVDVDGAVNSVDSWDGTVVAAVEGGAVDENGSVVFIDAASLSIVDVIEVGVLPDMVTFTPDGSFVLTANEGEPNDDYTIDPEGSVTVIRLVGPDYKPTTGRTASFHRFNRLEQELKDAGVRIFGPGATVAQDVEPEYITVSEDSRTAYVTLQENNALAVVDIVSARVLAIVPLGYKDYSVTANAIDASNDDGIDGNFQTYENVVGMYQPDAIAQYSGYLYTANEGDARDYDGYSEETRASDSGEANPDYPLDSIFDTDLLNEAKLGRLNTTTATGDVDGDGDFDIIHSYGARSMSVWDSAGNLVYDTGNLTERAVLANGTWDDGRSDDKGSEPEGVTIGKVGGVPYVFLGLERTSDVAIFDASDPAEPAFVQLLTAPAGAESPEGLEFVPAVNSPTGEALLIATYEVSSTIVVFEMR